MKESILIFCFAAILYLSYLFLYNRILKFAGRELRRSGISWQMDGTIHLEAMAENLEYYTRMALLVCAGTRTVVIHIRKNAKDREALLWMGEKFSARHPNLKIILF